MTIFRRPADSIWVLLRFLSKRLFIVGGGGLLLLAMAGQTSERGQGALHMTVPGSLMSSAVLHTSAPDQWSEKALLAQRDTAASVRWTLIALDTQERVWRARLQAQVDLTRGDSTTLHALHEASPLVTAYPWTLLSLAQHNAAREADAAGASVEAAIAAASAEVISGLFPMLSEQAADYLDAELRMLPDTSGTALGRRVALTRIAGLPAVDQSPTAFEYVGPMGWRTHPGRVPDGLNFAVAAPVVLDSAAQFRPAPPPSPESRDFADALAEVRQAAEDRTPAQRRAARFWALRNGPTEWTRRAAELLAREGTSDPEAIAVLARLQAAVTDANIACFEAKYHYGLLRPEHADSTITRPWAVSLPNFPAYPAAHACTAGAAETILVEALPGAEAEIRAAAHEMAESRLWGGVHYRFDNEAGLTLGHKVAQYVMAHPERLALSTPVTAD